MSISYRSLCTEDYDALMALWQGSEGVGLSDADSRVNIGRYLEHHVGLSWAALDGHALVGAVLAGHDYRRGYLHHLAVLPSHRRRGVGRGLVELALAGLKEQGMTKVHLFLFTNNAVGRGFWLANGWQERPDLGILSKALF